MKLVSPLAGLALALVLVPALAACSGKTLADPSPGPDATSTATTGATATPTPAGTPGSELPPSLRQVLADAATARNLPPPSTLKAELVARSRLPALLESLLTDEDRRWFAQTTTLYRLLGHLRKDQDYLTVWQSFGSDSIIGLYSPIHDQLWVVHDDGATIDFDNLPRQEKETLAHELIHAIQDYNFRLDEVYESIVDDLDRNLAWTAVVEGDAVTHEAAYAKRFMSLASPSGRALLLANFAQSSDVPPSIARDIYFPYTTGAAWIRAVVQEHGTTKVGEMLANPPRGTAFVLHPDLLDSGWQPEDVHLPAIEAALGSGWRKESGGQWGEFGIQNYLRLRIRSLDAVTAATGWAGDHYNVYVNGGQSAAVFRVKFASASDANEFASAQQNLLKDSRAVFSAQGAINLARTSDGNVTATIAPSGSEVVFAIGSSQDVALLAMQAIAG